MIRGKVALIGIALLTSGIDLVPTPADAAFPGRPGRIFFGRGAAGNQDIYSVRRDGSSVRRLTTATGADLHPRLSSDGRHVVYTCGASGYAYESGDICVMRADGSQRRKLTEGDAVDEQPSWSPDGTQVVFVRKVSASATDSAPLGVGFDTELFVIDLKQGEPTQLTEGVDHDYAPEWSPLGDKILFHRTPLVGDPDIWTIDPDGSDAENLTPGAAGGSGATWSPDGKTILFSRDMGERRKLHTMSARGGDIQQIRHRRSARNPSWSPTGRAIVFQDVYRSDRVVLFVVRADGSQLRRLIPQLRDDHHSPDWQPRVR